MVLRDAMNQRRSSTYPIGQFELPERKSLGHYVYESLKGAIIRGELKPGERVAESRVAEAMGISRTPVREAFHKLEHDGWLERQSSTGFFVARLSREDIEETFGIRAVLESYAAKLATIRHEKGDLEGLEEKISQYQRHLEAGDLEILPKINTDFHDILYSLSRSPKLISMINHLRDQIYRFRMMILKVPEMAFQSNRDHKMMLSLIRKRDEEQVERLVRNHILRGQQTVLELFESERRGGRRPDGQRGEET